jgi:hypothetical protein
LTSTKWSEIALFEVWLDSLAFFYNFCRTSTPVIFLTLWDAASTAFAVASSQLFGELPFNSTTLATAISTFLSWAMWTKIP